MPTVTRIFESRHVPGRWYAETDGGEALRVNVALIADFSLYTGRELSGEEYARLTAAASRMNARARALKLLGFRAMSRRELVDKLTQKGESPEDAQEAADYLEELGYLDDAQYAASLVRHYAGKGYGPGRVRQELFRRGVPRELWEQALAELPEDTDAVDQLIRRRLQGGTPDRKELKKLTDALLRRGFGWGEIKSALARYDFSEEYEDE